ncbi:MAG: ribonuclease P protein component [Dysosmobacter sp.]
MNSGEPIRRAFRLSVPSWCSYSPETVWAGTVLGLVSSTKLGHAVVRNRCRRRLREVYRLEKPQLKTGYDIILVARAELPRPLGRSCKDSSAVCAGSVDLMKEPV